MGKHTVSLRQRPRLVVESFEDRRLLSSGPGLFSVSSQWLSSTLLNRSLDTRSLTVLSPPAENTATTQVESKQSEEIERKLKEAARRAEQDSATRSELTEQDRLEKSNTLRDKDVHTQDELLGEDSDGPGEDSELPTEEDGENSGGSDLRGGEGDSDSGGEGQVEDGLRDGPGNTNDTQPDSADNVGDRNRTIRETLRERLEDRVAGETAPSPVVIQALKESIKENIRDPMVGQDGSGHLGNQNVPSSEAETPGSVGDGPSPSTGYEARPGQEVSHTPANPSSAETRAEVLGPNRPALARSDMTPPSTDHAGTVDGQTSGSLGHRAETGLVPARDVERPSLAQGLQRGASETAGTSRGQEVGEPRHIPQVLAVAAESAVSVALHRVGVTPRPAQQPNSHVLARAAEEATTETVVAQIADNAEPVQVRLGIMDMAAFIPHLSGLMQGSVPFDQDAMQAAMQQFLEQMENLGGDAASWLAQMNLSPWVVAIAVGLTGCEVARRRQQQAQRGLVLTDEDGTPLMWFPGLAGLWTMRDA